MNKPVFSINSFWMAIRYFLFLNSEQTKVLFTRKIDDVKTAPEWLVTLDNLTKFDEYADNARHTCFVLAWWGFALGVVLYIITLFTISNVSYEALNNNIFLWETLRYAYLLMFFGCFVCFLFYFLFKRVDLSNNLRFFTYPLIRILLEEGKENSPIQLQCQLAPPNSNRYKTAVRKNFKPSWFKRIVNIILLSIIAFAGIIVVLYNKVGDQEWFRKFDRMIGDFADFLIIGGFVMFFVWIIASFSGKYPKITNTVYTFPWLSFTAKMADDTVLSTDFVDTILQRKIVKSNPRGKVKTKYKNSLRRLTSITIGFDKENYHFSSQSLNKGGGGIQMKQKPNEKRHTFKMKDKQKIANTNNIRVEPSLGRFLPLIAEAYKKMQQVA
jgi:hypothetical protein